MSPRQLGQPLSELFSQFGDEPIGAASLGQVYKARTRDGRQAEVARRLVAESGKAVPVPLVHARLLYIEDELRNETRVAPTPAGSLYIVGGMKLPLTYSAEGIGSWADLVEIEGLALEDPHTPLASERPPTTPDEETDVANPLVDDEGETVV